MLSRLLRKKPIGHSPSSSSLRRSLTAFDLIFMGIGAIIGAGVFVLTGIVAATKAGPAVVISYSIAGIACLFAGLAYAELAASVGGTGSAYSYAYAGFGEFVAWIIGWDLLLEYSMSVSTVAIGWSGYVSDLLESINIPFPIMLTKSPFDGGIINLPALLIILALAYILSTGVKQSARFNTGIVFIKLLTIAVFIIAAIPNVKWHNWQDFNPFGFTGIMEGAALVFFAYIGFDALSTAVEETKDPQQNIPIGILVSLVVCTLIYIIVSALLTGIAPYETLNVRSPVANALLQIGDKVAAGFVAAGAIAGLTTVMLVMYYGLTRIILAMCRDGLMPSALAKINMGTHTPTTIIYSTGCIMAIVAGFAPIHRAAELVNIGTLSAFTFVCLGMIVMRYTHPTLPRPFKLPLHPLFPLLGVISCIYLMIYLSAITWLRFFIWATVGLFVYFSYGIHHSKLKK